MLEFRTAEDPVGRNKDKLNSRTKLLPDVNLKQLCTVFEKKSKRKLVIIVNLKPFSDQFLFDRSDHTRDVVLKNDTASIINIDSAIIQIVARENKIQIASVKLLQTNRWARTWAKPMLHSVVNNHGLPIRPRLQAVREHRTSHGSVIVCMYA